MYVGRRVVRSKNIYVYRQTQHQWKIAWLIGAQTGKYQNMKTGYSREETYVWTDKNGNKLWIYLYSISTPIRKHPLWNGHKQIKDLTSRCHPEAVLGYPRTGITCLLMEVAMMTGMEFVHDCKCSSFLPIILNYLPSLSNVQATSSKDLEVSYLHWIPSTLEGAAFHFDWNWSKYGFAFLALDTSSSTTIRGFTE